MSGPSVVFVRPEHEALGEREAMSALRALVHVWVTRGANQDYWRRELQRRMAAP